MKKLRSVVFALSLVAMTACATSGTPKVNFLEESRESVDVLLMPLDVEVRFVKVGSTDLRADWTELALGNFEKSITAHLESTGENVIDFEDVKAQIGDVDQLILLQQHVASAISDHVTPLHPQSHKGALPHMKGQEITNYSLGPDVQKLKAASGADYAAFLTNRSTIESSGSFWTKVAIGTVTGYTPALDSFKGTYVMLVDLNTGEVAWLNGRTGDTFLGGDPRSRGTTDAIVEKIMAESPFREDGDG